jgi:hypothetical protein
MQVIAVGSAGTGRDIVVFPRNKCPEGGVGTASLDDWASCEVHMGVYNGIYKQAMSENVEIIVNAIPKGGLGPQVTHTDTPLPRTVGCAFISMCQYPRLCVH